MKKISLFLLAGFLLPAYVALGVHAASPHPGSWRNADWSSAGILPEARDAKEAVIHLMVARTGGIKGALAVHSWIVTKEKDASSYTRYDKVGWGMPVRTNAYAADGRWYSNEPAIIKTIAGADATRLIPQIEAAVASYPYAKRGDYQMWPGPNSNTFIAHVLREVSELEMRLPPEAVGKDFTPFGDFASVSPDWRNAELSLGGYAGLAAGADIGLELRLGGLVLGADFARPAIKLPGFGRIGVDGM